MHNDTHNLIKDVMENPYSQNLCALSFTKISLCVLGSTALVLAFYCNYSTDFVPVTFAYDAEHYRTTCAMLIDVLRRGLLFEVANAWANHNPAELLAALLKFPPHLADNLAFDGPVLPTLFAFACLLCGKTLGVSDWRIVIDIQSILFAGSTMLIAVLGTRMSNSRLVGISTGLVFMLYPPMCLATQRFLNETSLIFLLCLFLCLCSFPAPKFYRSLFLGYIAGLIILIKAVLVVAVGAAIFCFCCQQSSKWKVFVATICGAVLAIGPWAISCLAVFGKPYIGAIRAPGLQLAAGMDIETTGMPITFLGPLASLCFNAKDPLLGAIGLFFSRPAACMELLVRKYFLLASFPWNDFHQGFLGFDAKLQIYWHFALLALSVLGILTLFFRSRQQQSLFSGLPIICLCFLAGHAVWGLFITCTRYVVTAAPIAILFAVYAVNALPKLNRRDLAACSLLWLVLSSLWIGMYFVLFPEAREQRIVIERGQSLKRQLDLSQLRKPYKLDTALMLVDGEHFSTETELYVNGKRLPGAMTSLYYFDRSRYSVIALDEINRFAQRCNFSHADEIRQWRAIEIPTQLLRAGKNTLEIRQLSGSCAIFADADKKSRKYPALFWFSGERFLLDPRRPDGRPIYPVKSAATAACDDKYLVEANGTTRQLTIEPRIKLLFVGKLPEIEDTKISEIVDKPLPAASFGFFDTGKIRRASELILGREYPAEYDATVDFRPIAGEHDIVEISGWSRSEATTSTSSVTCTTFFANGGGADVPLESRIRSKKLWQPFRVSGLITLPSHTEATWAMIRLHPADFILLQHYGLQKVTTTRFRDLAIRLMPVHIPLCNFNRFVLI